MGAGPFLLQGRTNRGKATAHTLLVCGMSPDMPRFHEGVEGRQGVFTDMNKSSLRSLSRSLFGRVCSGAGAGPGDSGSAIPTRLPADRRAANRAPVPAAGVRLRNSPPRRARFEAEEAEEQPDLVAVAGELVVVEGDHGWTSFSAASRTAAWPRRPAAGDRGRPVARNARCRASSSHAIRCAGVAARAASRRASRFPSQVPCRHGSALLR